MVTGLTYVRGRSAAETTEAGDPPRVAGQFAAPFLGAAVRAADSARVQLPATGLTVTSGAVVAYLDPDYDHDGGSQPASGRAFEWRASANERITGFYDKSAAEWRLEIVEGGASDTANVADIFSASAAIAVYFAWDASMLHVAVDGGIIQSIARTKTPAGLPSTIDVGSQDGSTNHIEAVFGAVALFSAPLTQAQWQALASLREVRPPCLGERADGTMSALWYGAHRLVWSADTAIDLNDSDDGDFRLLRLDGAGTAPVLNRVVQTPQRDGAVYVDTRLGPRVLTATLAVVGTEGWSSVWAKRREVAAALNPRRGAGVVMFAPDDTVYEINAVVEQGLSFSNPRGPHAQEQPVSFLCDDPAWRVAAQQEATIAAPAGGASVAASIPLGLTASGGTATLTNEGDLPSYPRIHVEIDENSTVDPKLANETLAREFVLDATYDDADSLEVDMDARTAVDGTGANQMGRRSTTSQMWALEPGGNSVLVDMSGGALTARVRWWTRLVGI